LKCEGDWDNAFFLIGYGDLDKSRTTMTVGAIGKF